MLNKNLMRIKKYCEPYMLAAFLVIVVLGVHYIPVLQRLIYNT